MKVDVDVEYGPYRLGPVDLITGTFALRFMVLPVAQRVWQFATYGVMAALAVFGAAIGDWWLFGAGIFLPAFLMILGPTISGLRSVPVRLRLTGQGILAMTGEVENLYKSVDVRRMRVFMGRLLIPVTRNCVLIVPDRVVGEGGLVKLETLIRTMYKGDQPTA